MAVAVHAWLLAGALREAERGRVLRRVRSPVRRADARPGRVRRRAWRTQPCASDVCRGTSTATRVRVLLLTTKLPPTSRLRVARSYPHCKWVEQKHTCLPAEHESWCMDWEREADCTNTTLTEPTSCERPTCPRMHACTHMHVRAG